MKQVIGIETTYAGAEHRHLVGYRLKITAVIRGASGRHNDPDALGAPTTEDETLAANRGLDAHDRVEVLPWIAQDCG